MTDKRFQPGRIGKQRPRQPLLTRNRIIVLLALVVVGLGVLGGLSLFWSKRKLTKHFDVLIVGGTVLDGTGAPPRQTTVGIIGGRIVPVEWDYLADADRIIDATDQMVAPGFIDVHTHIERNVQPDEPLVAQNFLVQGITTIITGNCGTSAPSLANFFRQLDTHGTAINVASLVGHNTVRRQVMGDATRNATPDELAHMRHAVERAMEDGALGFSTGLEYAPGLFAPTSEIESLAAVAGKYQGIYTTHMRDEGNSVVQSLSEALTVARNANVSLDISHLKARGRTNWGTATRLINMISEAQQSGLQVTCDAYPYTASSTTLDLLIPKPAREGGSGRLRERLRNPAEHQKVVAGILEQMRSEGWQDFSFARVASCQFAPQFNGLTIPEITAQLGRVTVKDIPANTGKKSSSAAGDAEVVQSADEQDGGDLPPPKSKPKQTENNNKSSVNNQNKEQPVPQGTPPDDGGKKSPDAAAKPSQTPPKKEAERPATSNLTRPQLRLYRQNTEHKNEARTVDDKKSHATLTNEIKADDNKSAEPPVKNQKTGDKDKSNANSAPSRPVAAPLSQPPVSGAPVSGSNTDQAETICYLAARGGAQMIFENMSQSDVTDIIRFPSCMLGSDSGVRVAGEGRPHPRGYGSAPRFLGLFARDEQLFNWEEAIRRITSLPAETFHIAERGKLLPGYWADVVVFNPATIKDQATYDQPFQLPVGVSYVLVNGQVAIDHGKYSSEKAGKVIKRQPD